MSNETIALKTTLTDGTHGEAQLFHMAQLNAEGQPLSPATALTATSNQATYVQAFTHATDAAVAAGDVDIRAVGKAPLNITSCVVTISDGRTVAGVPVQYQVAVTIVQNPDMSSIVKVSSDAVRAL